MSIYMYGNKVGSIKDKSHNIKRVKFLGYDTFMPKESSNYEDYGERVDYIYGGGTQYIFTDYIPNAKTDIEIDFSPEEYAKMLFGTRFDYTDDTGCLVYMSGGGDYYSGFDSINTRITFIGGASMPLDTKFNIRMNKNEFLFNGIKQNSSYFGDYSIPNTLEPLAIFASRTTGTQIDPRIAKGKLYGVIIREDSTIVMNLIPVRLTKQSYGKYTKGSYVMWDTVSNTIPEHIGTFIGPSTGGDPYIRTEYTTLPGGAYSNLFIKANSNQITRGKVRSAVNAGEGFMYGARDAYLNATNSFFTSTGNNLYFVGYGSNWKSYVSYELTEWIEFYQDIEKSIVNNVTRSNGTQSPFTGAFDMHIGALNNGGSIETRTYKGDISYLQIEENAIMLCDIFSCILLETNEAGFWNNVTNEFIGSDTNVKFIAGPIQSETNYNIPTAVYTNSNGDFIIEHEGELYPRWIYDETTGNIYTEVDEGDKNPISIDSDGNVIYEEI